MTLMAKKKPPKPDPEGPSDDPAPTPKRRPPSRDKVRYTHLPSALYEWLDQYAADHSDELDRKSAAWAARRAVAFFKRIVESEGDPYDHP